MAYLKIGPKKKGCKIVLDGPGPRTPKNRTRILKYLRFFQCSRAWPTSTRGSWEHENAYTFSYVFGTAIANVAACLGRSICVLGSMAKLACWSLTKYYDPEKENRNTLNLPVAMNTQCIQEFLMLAKKTVNTPNLEPDQKKWLKNLGFCSNSGDRAPEPKTNSQTFSKPSARRRSWTPIKIQFWEISMFGQYSSNIALI